MFTELLYGRKPLPAQWTRLNWSSTGNIKIVTSLNNQIVTHEGLAKMSTNNL